MRPLDIVRTPNGDIAVVVEVTERGDSSIEYLPHQERRDWKSAWWGVSDLTVLGNIAETLTNAQDRKNLMGPTGAVCLDCGKPYEQFPLDVILPRPQWLVIHPDEDGLLCASCIVERAGSVPGVTCVHAILEIRPHPTVNQ